jgi:hypothetical protein
MEKNGKEAITNVPTEPLRWSLIAACREFAINRVTLQRRFTEVGIAAGSDGLYGTADIVSAIMGGSIAAEKLRKTTAEATNMEIKNSTAKRDYLPRQEVLSCMEGTFHEMAATIKGSGVDESLKRSLLQSLADIEPPA